jgi:hypothetical protein
MFQGFANTLVEKSLPSGISVIPSERVAVGVAKPVFA